MTMRDQRRYFIVRHGETVFNASGRLQGDAVHTPLTRAGFAQANEIGEALRDHLGLQPKLDLWASPTGRALQTLAVITEHLGLDWHDARTDHRLAEIDVGVWGGRYYRELADESGPVIDPGTGLFARRAPAGEWYDQLAVRLRDWLHEDASLEGDRLLVMHGMSSRVLRAILTGSGEDHESGVRIAPGVPQGAVVMIAAGVETIIRRGDSVTVGY